MATMDGTAPLIETEAQASSIPFHVKECLLLFERLQGVLLRSAPKFDKEIQETDVSNEAGRFRIWAGNIGAHMNGGRSSLNYQLRDASHIRTKVESLLQDLQVTIRDVSGEKIPWDKMTRDSDSASSESESSEDEFLGDTELRQLHVSMKKVTTFLLRISMAIRNPAAHDQFLNSSNLDTSPYEFYDIQHVLGKFPDADPELVRRLGKAISKRRLYFKYREMHKKKIATGTIPEEEKNAHEKDAATELQPRSTIVSSLSRHTRDKKHHQKGTTTGITEPKGTANVPCKFFPEGTCQAGKACPFLHTNDRATETAQCKYFQKGYCKFGAKCALAHILPDGRRVNSPNLAMTENMKLSQALDLEADNKSVSGITQTSFATSADGDGEHELKVPPLPKQEEGGHHFVCPFCFMAVSIKSRRTWENHVFTDLRPYVCTFPKCTSANKLFARRHEWLQHERQAHRRWWECIIQGCSKRFDDGEDFECHVKDDHAELSSEDQLISLLHMSERKTDMETIMNCSLCGLSLPLSQLEKHIGKHQEQLALFSLPSTIGEFGNDPNSEKTLPSVSSQIEDERQAGIETEDERQARLEREHAEGCERLRPERAADEYWENHANPPPKGSHGPASSSQVSIQASSNTHRSQLGFLSPLGAYLQSQSYQPPIELWTRNDADEAFQDRMAAASYSFPSHQQLDPDPDANYHGPVSLAHLSYPYPNSIDISKDSAPPSIAPITQPYPPATIQNPHHLASTTASASQYSYNYGSADEPSIGAQPNSSGDDWEAQLEAARLEGFKRRHEAREK